VDVDGIVRHFETLTPDSARELARIYTDDAAFRDPFNDVRGVAAIEAIFAKMFETLHEPRFTVVRRIVDGPHVVLLWDFDFRIRKFRPAQPWRIHGASHLELAGDGRIAMHRDYWDTAEELYAKLPLVGALMRFLKRQLA
jgi:steroid delta-isomerase